MTRPLLITLICTAAIFLGCASTSTNPRVPEGYKACSSDLDCPEGQYCGFVARDTVPVCKD